MVFEDVRRRACRPDVLSSLGLCRGRLILPDEVELCQKDGKTEEAYFINGLSTIPIHLAFRLFKNVSSIWTAAISRTL